jgi:hypothetical protein
MKKNLFFFTDDTEKKPWENSFPDKLSSWVTPKLFQGVQRLENSAATLDIMFLYKYVCKLFGQC